MDAPELKSIWLLPPVIFGLYWLHTAWSWTLAGVIGVVVGTLVALDYGGVAKRIPAVLVRPRMRWNWKQSVGGTRRTFAGIAVWGFVMILLAQR